MATWNTRYNIDDSNIKKYIPPIKILPLKSFPDRNIRDTYSEDKIKRNWDGVVGCIYIYLEKMFAESAENGKDLLGTRI